MKRMFAALLALVLLMPALAFAQGNVLLVNMPQEAQMVENVAFDDGDFIQTYQLAGGAQVQLLRYAAFDMTLGDLIASEWIGAQNVRELSVREVSGYSAQGLRFTYSEAGEQTLDVTLMVVDAGEKLVLSAVFPAGAQGVDETVQGMLDSLSVMHEDAAPEGDMADVG